MLRCIEKYRDKNGNIIGYLLMDINTYQTTQISSKELKNLIKRGKVKIENLTLTSDGRLIENNHIKIGSSPTENTLHKQNISNNKQLSINGVRQVQHQAETQQNKGQLTTEQIKAQEKRKKAFNKTMDFMKDIGCIMFMGKTLDQHREEKARRSNNGLSWEDNYHELNEHFDAGGEFGDIGGEFN